MKVLIIDDHAIILKGLNILLKELFMGAEITEAHTVEEAMKKYNAGKYKLVVMDLSLPDSDGLKLLEYFLEREPKLSVLVFSMNNEDIYARRALQLGAKGYVSKTSDYSVLRQAIQKVCNGGIYVSDNVLSKLLFEKSFGTAQADYMSNPFDHLTKRELEIVRLMYLGKGTKDIATATGLKSNTISTFKAKIFDKMDITSLNELLELIKIHGIN